MVSEPTDTSREAVLGDVNPRFLIRKYGGFYRPNSQGYTGSAIQAGRYTLDEAERITHPNGPDGPRDGMSFIHEDDLRDENWEAYSTLLARAEAAEAKHNTTQTALMQVGIALHVAKVEARESAMQELASLSQAQEAYEAQLRAEAERDALQAENVRLRDALEKMHHAVCGETGFANRVRMDSGKAYPWEALDLAEEKAAAALAALEAKP